jgi:hypothetical protein
MLLRKSFLGLAAAAALATTVSAYAAAPADYAGRSGPPWQVNRGSAATSVWQGQGGLNNNVAGATLVATAPAGEAEAAALQYMREEEKLAHDVYTALFARWGLPTFQNIAGSEQTHTDAVATLLARYAVVDPAAGLPAGQFANPELQQLYDQLVDEGSQSLAAALRVGAKIEEIDIADLQERLAQTDKADIQNVYQNLLRGSGNHLRAFVSTLQRQTGETYSAQYLPASEYDQLLGSGSQAGGSGPTGVGGGRGAGR